MTSSNWRMREEARDRYNRLAGNLRENAVAVACAMLGMKLLVVAVVTVIICMLTSALVPQVGLPVGRTP
jgi:hypothetical protein